MIATDDTIVALATAPGMGAISIIRVSGPQAIHMSQKLCGKTLAPRMAILGSIQDDNGQRIDTGLFFAYPGPNSFTGEDVCEFQGHGGTIVAQAVINEFIRLGAVPARPGQFSERAFLNGKIDLIQAEAISDLIHASSIQAVKAANQSLDGVFSKQVGELTNQLIKTRVHAEAHLDFPDEEISPTSLTAISNQLFQSLQFAQQLKEGARQGVVLSQGLQLVLLGLPNTGKSSLLNCLAKQPLAIVTDIPGTTRDTIHHDLVIDGLQMRFIDTAGIRETSDQIEAEGVRRAFAATQTADIVVCLFDQTNDVMTNEHLSALLPPALTDPRIILVQNKLDLDSRLADNHTRHPLCHISARTGAGIDTLIQQIKTTAGITQHESTAFTARERHLYQLSNAIRHLESAHCIPCSPDHLDLIAEDLRLAHIALQEMTGEFKSDDLLGEIFSTFCIGK